MAAPAPLAVTPHAAAARSGQYAARRGMPVTACPYDPADPEHAPLAESWTAAYLSSSAPTINQVDYGADTPEA